MPIPWKCILFISFILILGCPIQTKSIWMTDFNINSNWLVSNNHWLSIQIWKLSCNVYIMRCTSMFRARLSTSLSLDMMEALEPAAGQASRVLVCHGNSVSQRLTRHLYSTTWGQGWSCRLMDRFAVVRISWTVRDRLPFHKVHL